MKSQCRKPFESRGEIFWVIRNTCFAQGHVISFTFVSNKVPAEGQKVEMLFFLP